VAAAVTVAVLVLARPQDRTPGCLRSTQTLEDLSQAVATAGGAKGLSVVSAADRAEIRRGRPLCTRNEQLHAVFSDLKDAVALLREAARTGSGGDAVIDRVLTLIDTLEARCQTALAPTGSAAAPTR